MQSYRFSCDCEQFKCAITFSICKSAIMWLQQWTDERQLHIKNSKAIIRLIGMLMAMRHRYRLNLSNNAPNLHRLQTEKRRTRQKHTIEMYEVTTSNSLLSVWQMMFEHTYLADLHIIKTNEPHGLSVVFGFFFTILCRPFAFQA